MIRAVSDGRTRRNLLAGKFLSHFLAAALVVAVSAAAFAEGGTRAEVDRLYFHRDQAGNLERSIARIDELLKTDPAADLYWRRCRSIVRRGELRDKKSAKLDDYDLARQDCEKSVKLDDKDPDAHFWYGVSMGRWGEAKGIMKAMFLIKPIRAEMAATLKLDPNYGGAHRVLGEMLWQIPGFAGGDKKKALEEYETAIRLSPNYSANYQVLAEAYVHFDRKDDAIKTLNGMLAIKEPADPAEFLENAADAKKLLAKLTQK